MNRNFVLVLVKDGIVEGTPVQCGSREELHDRFADEFVKRDMSPQDEDFDNGYYEFDDGRSVNMCFPEPSDTPPSGKR